MDFLTKEAFAIVSSASADYFDSVGYRLVDSLAVYEPSVPFFLYSEDIILEKKSARKIILDDKDALLKCLKDREARAHDGTSGVRYRVFPFYFKVMAISQAFKDLAGKFEFLVWLDADCVLTGPSKLRNLVDVVKGSKGRSGYFGRPFYKCAETGLVIFNCASAGILLDQWVRTYENLDSYDEWHDAFLFSQVVSESDVEFCKHFGLRSNHPINELCGGWLDHQKGDRKGIGGSRIRDIYLSSMKNFIKQVLGR